MIQVPPVASSSGLERSKSSPSRSSSPPLPPPPLPAKSTRPFPAHVQAGDGRPLRAGSIDIERSRSEVPPPVRRTAGSFSAYGAADDPRRPSSSSASSSQATTRNNSITSATSTATLQQQYPPASAPAPGAFNVASPYGQRSGAHSLASSQSTAPPFINSFASSARSLAPSVNGSLYGQNHFPSKASVSAYDAKAIFSSFDSLPPLPPIPSSQNPHPAPDPTSAGINTQPYPHPSHPTSALSSLFLHVLPCFNGDPLRNPIESLNTLVSSHITATFARYSSPARVLSTLTADLRDILGSGMLTLEAKLHAVDEDKLVGRLVDVWVFFWTAVVPYIEGIFLPLTLDSRIVEAAELEQSATNDMPRLGRRTRTHAINPRLQLLTLFLISLLHPHLSRLLPLLAPPHPVPTPAHLARLQQMALILLTQTDPQVTGGPETIGDKADEGKRGSGGVREGLEGLLRAVGAASRARAEGTVGVEGERRPVAPAPSLGSTPVKKGDRRGGWIAGKHKRAYSQANASIPKQEDGQAISPTTLTTTDRSSLAFASGTAKNVPSHLRSAETPRQPTAFQRGGTTVDGQGGGGGSHSFATPTYTATGGGGGLRSTGGMVTDEAGYLDALRSPDLPWSGASSPTQSASHAESDLDESDDYGRELEDGLEMLRSREGSVATVNGAGGARRDVQGQRVLDDRRHSSPPGMYSAAQTVSLGEAL